MTPRPQRTLARTAEISGFGLFTGEDVAVRCLPAPEHHGLAFQRLDLPGQPRLPALIQYVEPGLRRTVLRRGAAHVQVVEHLLAALAGLQIDNCLIQMTASEPPAGDGSADHFVAPLLDAGLCEQRAARRVCVIDKPDVIAATPASGSIELAPVAEPHLQLTYDLDYPGTPVGRQSCSVTIAPRSFVAELSYARTFVFEAEVDGMRSQGFGLRASTDNLVVFGPQGPIDCALRGDTECARHKALDCVGDFALLGCDIIGAIHCRQSGHSLNHELIRRLDQQLRTRTPLAAAG
jgi:UDP-3-O-[3-hydroxymyristoyl] N-acetylglucosamine deacetylase/UDP-3-O-[3-hydroxymyristoyl] N-acetylglucosamine deacetylase/3-hydroxyacyl-[acyl-carrier-protein] dehydratase